MKLRGSRERASVTVLVLACALIGPFACAAGDDRTSPTGDDGGSPVDGNVATESSMPDAAQDADAAGDAIVQSHCSSGGFCYYPLPVQKPLSSLSASSVDDAWAMAEGAIVRWNGTVWSEVHRPPLPPTSGGPVAIWVTKSDDVWALSGGSLVRYSAKGGGAPSFRSFALDSVAFAEVLSLWAAASPSSDAVWVASGVESVLRVREAAQGSVDPLEIETMLPRSGPDDMDAYTWTHVVGFGPDDVYVAGAVCPEGFNCRPPRNNADPSGAIAHYDGTGWTITSREKPILAMSGARTPDGARRLWLVEGLDPGPLGFGPWDASLQLVPVADDASLGAPLVTEALSISPWGAGCDHLSVSAASAEKAWLSDGCLVHRWNGSALETMPTSIQNVARGRVNAIWAANPDEGWIVGEASPQGAGFPEHTGFAGQRKAEWARDGGQP